MKTPARKHYWVSKLIRHKKNLINLKQERDLIKREVVNKVMKESPVKITAPVAEKASWNHDKMKAISKTIHEEELIVEFLEKTEKSVVYFNYTQIEECDILKYYKENDVLNFLSYSLRRVEKLLPVKIYISKYSIDYLSHLLSKKDGKAYTTVNSIITKMNNIDITKFTFSGVKKFTKQYELSFLNNDYFNRLSTKQLMLK